MIPGATEQRTALPAGARAAGVMGIVFFFMLGDSLVQTTLPIGMAASGETSGLVIGSLIALLTAVGIVSALPAAAWGDRFGRGPVIYVSAAVGTLALIAIALVAYGNGAVWWVLPVLGYGLSRVSLWVSTLAVVASVGSPLRMQGLNSTVQRASAAVAALATAAVIAWNAWQPTYLALAVVFAALIVAGRRAIRFTGVDGPIVTPWRSYGAGLRLLREKSLQASSLVAVAGTTVMLLGNSFFALALDLEPAELAVAVLVLLMARDVASVVMGPFFPWVVERVGLTGTIAGLGALGAAGLGLVVLAEGQLVVIGVGAALQGGCIALVIGTTNILATGPGASAGKGLRIASTNIWISAASIVLPVLFGALSDLPGIGWVFGPGAVVVGLCAVMAILLVRQGAVEPSATESGGGT